MYDDEDDDLDRMVDFVSLICDTLYVGMILGGLTVAALVVRAVVSRL